MQDEIELVQERLRLTLGSKFERNDFTGFELQPSARLLWTITASQSGWAAVSRAVRTPTMIDDESALKRGPITTFGSKDFDSEVILAHELGYRANPVRWLALDIATFYNQYDRLASIETTAPTTRLRANKLNAETYGAELAAAWLPAEWFTLRAAYTSLRVLLHTDAGSTDTASALAEGNDPRQQFSLRGSLALPRRVDLDGSVRYVEGLPNLNVPGYVAVDMRLAWRPTDRFEAAIVGQNLFDDQHLEFPTGTLHKDVPRGVYGKVTWRF